MNAFARTLVVSVVVFSSACMPVRWGSKPESGASSSSGSSERSSRGNPPVYEVFGKRYYVLDSAAGYQERGVASWYGKKFHGKPTSSGERYDMHKMTAAHKTLPLPTDVRVTNLRNGRSVTVRVNDRGPFIDNRIIDMSYAAAKELDMVRDGTTLVEVVALTAGSKKPSRSLQAGTTHSVPPRLYLQVGAFSDRMNAERLKLKLVGGGVNGVVIHPEASNQGMLYRVRIGPIRDVAQYDRLVAQVAELNVRDTYIVTAPATNGTNQFTKEG